MTRGILSALVFVLVYSASALYTPAGGQTPSEEEFRRKIEAERLAGGHSARKPLADNPSYIDSKGRKIVAESMHVVAAFLLESDRVVLNKPFSADTETSTVNRLGPRLVTVKESVGRVYRDRDGRTRREQTLKTLGPITGGEFAVISDPVSQIDMILDPLRKTIRKFGNTRIDSSGPAKPAPTATEDEDLGDRMIEGLNCRGKRHTTKVGEVTILTDTWTTPAIEGIVFWIRYDPRFGKTTCSMLHIKLGDPPVEVFQAPAGYKIEFEGPSGVMMKRKEN